MLLQQDGRIDSLRQWNRERQWDFFWRNLGYSTDAFWLGIATAIVFLGALAFTSETQGHEIYTNLHGKDGQLCCGGDDCAVTIYRERRGHYEFQERSGAWVEIPQDRITFLPIPNDDPLTHPVGDEEHRAHLCYRDATTNDRMGGGQVNVFGDIFLYCAFIPPGSI